MGLGILEDKHLKHVPGTSIFSTDPNAVAAAAFDGVDLSTLKRKGDIILVPQPTADPNDPLNWSAAKKWGNFMVLTAGTVMCGALGPLLSAGQVDLAEQYNVSLSAISRALGTSLVSCLAISTIFWAAISTKIGKRPVYVAATCFMLIGTIIAGEAKNYGTLLGSRIIQGIGQAPLEFLVGSSIAEQWHVHERGVPVAIWTIALLNGINITPPIAGAVYENLGFRWCWRIFSIGTAVLLLVQLVFLPETTYKRSTHLPAVASAPDVGLEKGDLDHVERSSAPSLKQKTFVQEMKLYNGIFERERSFLGLLLEPFKMAISPVVLFAVALYGLAITFLVLVATGSAQIFVGTYNFSTAAVGNTYVSALVADFIAAALAGTLTDWTAARLSRRNSGTFEPEYRLPLAIFYLVFGGMGFFGFGICVARGTSYWGPIIFFGILNFGITIGCHAIIAYVVECHRHSSDAALGAVIFGKNALSAIFTSFTNNWLASGIPMVFYAMGIMAVGTSLLALPMWVFGKRVRSWITRTLHVEKEEKTAVAS
ncbi:hypothetical protein JCM6882_008876 [Rhodosporidiobolus microsporus]